MKFEYEGIDPNTLDRIAADVRKFDAIQSTDAKQQRDVKRIADALEDMNNRAAKGWDGENSSRTVIAVEIQAVAALALLPTARLDGLKERNMMIKLLAERYSL